MTIAKNEIKSIEKGVKKADGSQSLAKLAGVDHHDFALSIVSTASSAIEPFLGNEESLNTVLHSMADLKPQNSLEARLIAQSAVLFEFSMKAFKRSAEGERLEHIEAMTNMGVKLMRVHNETIEIFNRCRRGSEQKITVTHAVMANQVQMNNNFNGGVPKEKEGTTSCILENVEPEQKQMTIAGAKTLQCEMGNADCMAEKVLVRGLRKACNG